jgi:hypothetical protein
MVRPASLSLLPLLRCLLVPFSPLLLSTLPLTHPSSSGTQLITQAPSKKAGKKLGGLLSSVTASSGGGDGGKAKVTKADWSEGFKKKKSAGVPDMTLLSTITNEAINENIKQRFNNQEIYVSGLSLAGR